MSTNKVIIDDAELAKSYITNSTLSDEYKRIYLRLINISTMATNGITQDEKIQKMTECIQLLAVTQGMYLANIDHKIENAIERANSRQCETCKAMKHAQDIEKENRDKEMLDAYLKKMGIEDKVEEQNNKTEEQSWTDILKVILTKPYIYVILGLMMVSPYSVDIVKTICQFFAK